MKKTMSLMLTGAMVFTLWGCGGGTSGTTSVTGTTSGSGSSSGSGSGSSTSTTGTTTGDTGAGKISYLAVVIDDTMNNPEANDIMIANGISGTLYITTDWVGDGASHLTWSDIQYLKGLGWEIGNHTKSHPHPLDITLAAFAGEVDSANMALLEHGIHASAFAIPYGEGYALNSAGQVVLNSGLLGVLNGLGYIKTSRQAFTGDNTTDLNDPKTFNPMAIKAFGWKGSTPKSQITGLIDQASAVGNNFLVLNVHKVTANPDPNDPDQISLDTFREVCEYIHAHADKIKPVTISQGAAAMKQ